MAKPLSRPADVELARVALRAACSVPGVVRSSAETGSPPGADTMLPGAVCVPLPGGGFRLELNLVASLVSLPELAEQVRDRVERAASRAGLASELRAIDIAFRDVDDSPEAQPAPRRRLTRRGFETRP